MFSILIPTFEHDCSKLIDDLNTQCQELHKEQPTDFMYEIIVSDDCSTKEHYRTLREKLKNIPFCTLIYQEKNTGRARNRNILVGMAQYKWVILIDDDAEVCTPDFIRTYWTHRHEADVVCGSLKNPQAPPQREHELRYVYEHHAQKHRSVQYKNNHPYDAFTTFNALFKKDIFERIHFDERCKEYGYEDALLGITLEKKECSILHIDNPLIHAGIDCNSDFLKKTEASLRTLKHLGFPMQLRAGTSRYYSIFKRLHAAWLLRLLFRLLNKKIRRNLLGSHPKVFLLNTYKLLYYSQL